MRPGELSPDLGDLVPIASSVLSGVPIVTSGLMPRGVYYTATDPAERVLVMCHPSQVELLKAGIEAVEIVRAGLADVLEWLGDAYPPKPKPRNRPMPARDLAPMIERISAMYDVPSELVEPAAPAQLTKSWLEDYYDRDHRIDRLRRELFAQPHEEFVRERLGRWEP